MKKVDDKMLEVVEQVSAIFLRPVHTTCTSHFCCDVLIGCRISATRSTDFVALSDRNAIPIPSSNLYLANLIRTERLRVTEASALLTETLH